MSGGAAVRRAVAGDLAGLLALYAELHPEDAAPPAERDERSWDAMLGSDRVRVFVAESPQAGLIASCCLAVVPNLTRGARPFGVIENVVTQAAHRRRGHGLAVLRAAVAAARDTGCYKVCLATGSRQASTLRFYEAAGFTRGTKTCFETRWP